MSTAAIHREVIDHIGGFDEQLAACEDYDFWLRVTACYPVFLIPQALTIKEGGHPDQQSKKYAAMDKLRIYALKNILERGQLKKDYYEATLNELKHKCAIYIQGAEKRGKRDEANYYRTLITQLEPSQSPDTI